MRSRNGAQHLLRMSVVTKLFTFLSAVKITTFFVIFTADKNVFNTQQMRKIFETMESSSCWLAERKWAIGMLFISNWCSRKFRDPNENLCRGSSHCWCWDRVGTAGSRMLGLWLWAKLYRRGRQEASRFFECLAHQVRNNLVVARR